MIDTVLLGLISGGLFILFLTGILYGNQKNNK